jgi:DNA-directed RNA polymerase subunit beta
VTKKKLTEDVRWLRADEESQAYLAPADAPTDGQKVTHDRVIARIGGDFASVLSEQVQYMCCPSRCSTSTSAPSRWSASRPA